MNKDYILHTGLFFTPVFRSLPLSIFGSLTNVKIEIHSWLS